MGWTPTTTASGLIEILTAREAQTWTPHDIYLRALLELYEDDIDLLVEDDVDGDGYTPGPARRGHPDRLSASRLPARPQRSSSASTACSSATASASASRSSAPSCSTTYVNREGLRALVIVPAALRDSLLGRPSP